MINTPDRPDQPPHGAYQEDTRDPVAVADAVAALDSAADALLAAADALQGVTDGVGALTGRPLSVRRLCNMSELVRHWAREVERC